MRGTPDLFELFLNEMRVNAVRLTIPVRSAGDFHDMGIRSYFYGKEAPFTESLPEIDWAESEPAKIYMMRDMYDCRYILMAAEDAPGRCWLIGPYLASEPTNQDIAALCRKLGNPENGSQFIHNYFKMLPKLLDRNMTEVLIRSQAAMQYPVRGFQLIPWDMGTTAALTGRPAGAGADSPQRGHLEQTYTVENQMIDCIAQGNAEGAMALLSRLERNGLDAKGDSILRDGKNALIVLGVLSRVGAYRGHVHPEQLDGLSRSLILKIESATKLAELHPLRDEIIRSYCSAVRKKNGQAFSPVVQKVVDTVEGSFDGELSLQGLAQQFNVSPSYLSTLFRKETGEAFTEYLLQKRLLFARKLLEETDLPVKTVASECGIPDNNYFSRVFKAQLGVTPLQYRAKQRQDGEQTGTGQ